MWAGPEGQPDRIALPAPDHAILLSLKSSAVRDWTYDSRLNAEGVSWSFAKASAIRLPDEHESWIGLETSEKAEF